MYREAVSEGCFSVNQHYYGNEIKLMNLSHRIGIILQGGTHRVVELKGSQ